MTPSVAPDKEISNAVVKAASHLTKAEAEGKWIIERTLADGLAEGIQSSVVERLIEVPGWEPQPGNTDVWTTDELGTPILVIETKLKATNDIYECLWDMAKLLSLSTRNSVEAAYVVAGTTEHWWEKPAACADMFESGTYPLVGRIQELRGWWIKYILGDNSTGRPTAVPAEVNVTRVGSAKLQLKGKPWELRAVRIRAEPEDPSDWIPFVDGLPVSP